MRFFADGPRIPDQLLEERDKGNVVFFCGAGISRPAGLPGFLGLAHQLITTLGTPAEAKSRLLLNHALQGAGYTPPLDQIFQHLQQEYGVAVIEDAVSKLLETPQKPNLEYHAIILRLSQDAARRPQIVTTNFDLLFEQAARESITYMPPALPDLSFDQRLEGIVYLHGRRSIEPTDGRERRGLVLSSADFGRAYLAEGWATRFVRDLLRNYVIVLIGYSASDPPVRYLLEGLHSRDDKNPAAIYAFDAGTDAEVKDRWRDRGVHALAYPAGDNDHRPLWDSLRAWAERSDDPDAWRRSICNLARQGPRNLAPHQRGQVASLIRTAAGAKLFAEATDSPPSEWLCVFDKYLRYATPRKAIGDEPEFDPLDHYRLDDDPPRPPADRNQEIPGEDFVSSNPFDNQPTDNRRLAGVPGRWSNLLPPRLFHFSRWLCNRLDDPAFMWWASGYQTLHPVMLEQIELEFERTFNSRSELARRVWPVLFEKFHFAPEDQHDFGWYRFSGSLKHQGWTKRIRRELERVLQPHVVSQRAWRRGPRPPEPGAVALSDIADFEVHFPPAEIRNLAIPVEHLAEVFVIARRALARAADLLEEIETAYWQTATFHPEQKAGERYLNAASMYLHWVAVLFDRLANEQPDFARTELQHWPNHDEFFFDKLKLYAWMTATVFDGNAVAEGLEKLSGDGFWNTQHRRELLHLMRGRWSDFSESQRQAIEGRILAGRPRYQKEEEDHYLARKSITSAILLGWLEQQGCELSLQARERLPLLRQADLRWQPSWDAGADDSHEGRSGWVKTEPRPDAIIDTPISELAQLAQLRTTQVFGEFVRYEPFAGLAQQKPARALAALAYEARHGRYPIELWKMTLESWPESTSNRLCWHAARRIARLPSDAISKLRFHIPDWLRKHLPGLAKMSLSDALALWDVVLQSLCAGGPENTQSGLGDVSIGGVPQKRSRRTYDHAINSPIGRMAETLFVIIGERELTQHSGLPTEIKARLERLLTTPGEGADHAVLEMTIRLRWLHYVDPDWVHNVLVPLFNTESAFAEPAWNGLLHDNQLPTPDLFVSLKPHFLKLFEIAPQWSWDTHAFHKLSQFLVLACYWHQQDDRYVSFTEARSALQQANDEMRSQAAWFLGSIMRNQNNWKTLGKPFIENAWPREARFQTPTTSHQFAMLAEEAEDEFPDVVQTILPLVVPVRHISLLIFRGKQQGAEEGSGLAARYPESMLALLDRVVPDAPHGAPFDLREILDIIADAAPGLRQDPRWRRLNKLLE